jgi:parallel beta-helix repeat protein
MIYLKNRLTVPLFLVLLLSSFFYGCVEVKNQNSEHIVYVNWDGSADFTSIQKAIDNITTINHYTVYVYNGSYKENIVINKSISLIGQDAASTIINANKTTDGIRINADQVDISGFTIKDSGIEDKSPNIDAGIDIEAKQVNISDCILINDTIGIYTNRAPNCMFYDNEIQRCTDYGMYLYSNSDYTVIKNNVFSDNPLYCLRIKGSKYTQVVGNVFMNNKYGMYFCCGASNNTVFHNSFINNSEWHADDYVGNNLWSNDDIQEGNFWDSYYIVEQGAYDKNNDGIIDSPYLIKVGSKGENIQDDYPLVKPYTDYKELIKII